MTQWRLTQRSQGHTHKITRSLLVVVIALNVNTDGLHPQPKVNTHWVARLVAKNAMLWTPLGAAGNLLALQHRQRQVTEGMRIIAATFRTTRSSTSTTIKSIVRLAS